MSQAPHPELRDTAQQLRRSIARYDPTDALIQSLESLADATEAIADGEGTEAIDRWREDYQQKRSRGEI